MGKLTCIREAAKIIGLYLNGAKVAVQGYGNAGFWAIKIFKMIFIVILS